MWAVPAGGGSGGETGGESFIRFVVRAAKWTSALCVAAAACEWAESATVFQVGVGGFNEDAAAIIEFLAPRQGELGDHGFHGVREGLALLADHGPHPDAVLHIPAAWSEEPVETWRVNVLA